MLWERRQCDATGCAAGLDARSDAGSTGGLGTKFLKEAIPSPILFGMARDPGLEELVESAAGDARELTGKAMFGGWGFLLHGNLLCGVRRGSLMLRVGPENESWALEIPGVVPVMMRKRRMRGYVRAGPEAYANDAVRARLLKAAVEFVRRLPKKKLANGQRKRS